MNHDADQLDLLLACHRDVQVIEPRPGRPALIRRHEVLVDHGDAAAAESLLRRWIDGAETTGALCRIRLRPKAAADVCALVRQVVDEAGLALAPNHLMWAQPIWFGGPADRPHPVEAPRLPRRQPTRRSVTVALLDTGISPHPWFTGTDWYASHGEAAREILDEDRDGRLDAVAGHGTFIAGRVLQVAPTAGLRVTRILDGDGVTDEWRVVGALAPLAARSPRAYPPVDVVNISFGCYTYDDRPSPVLARAVAGLGPKTVTVACAGNAANSRPFWPAALDRVIGVGALDVGGTARASFSNFGPWVNCCAPGEHVRSSFVDFDGPAPPRDGNDPDRFTGYARWSGTSFAAPHVAGLIAERCAITGEDAPTAAHTLLAAAPRRLPGLGAVLADDKPT